MKRSKQEGGLFASSTTPKEVFVRAVFRRDNGAFVMYCPEELEDSIKSDIKLISWWYGEEVPEVLKSVYGDDPVAALKRDEYRAPPALHDWLFNSTGVINYLRVAFEKNFDRVVSYSEVMDTTGCSRTSVTTAIADLQNPKYSRGGKMVLERKGDLVRRARWYVRAGRKKLGPFYSEVEANDEAGPVAGTVEREVW